MAGPRGGSYDLSKGQPTGLTGVLDYVVFAGPPNYKSVQKGDTPNPSFVLRLAQPICIQGRKSADPKTSFQTVQLVKTAKVVGKLKPLLHQHITVTLEHPGIDTVHRQSPLFAWVTGIAPTTHQTEFLKKRVPVPRTRQMEIAKAKGTADTTHLMKFAKEPGTAATRQMELPKKPVPTSTTHQIGIAEADGAAATTHHRKFAKETGTTATTDQVEVAKEHRAAATTVTAFYAGLADGRGDIASAMVVPQKRAHGPFSADELSHFYGNLKEPIRLESVETNGPTEFFVQYRYAASTRECNGRALVKTIMLSGKNYIKSINALDHC